MVVDGQAQFVGSNGREAHRAIEKAARQAKAAVDVEAVDRSDAKVSVKIGFRSHGRSAATVYVAVAEVRAESQVGKGENSGRRLQHVAAVRALVTAGTVKAGERFFKQMSLSVPAGAGKGGLRVVAFVQERSSGRVLGVMQLAL